MRRKSGERWERGDLTHWHGERGKEKARVHTKGMEIVKRTNEHLPAHQVHADAHSYASLAPFPRMNPCFTLSPLLTLLMCHFSNSPVHQVYVSSF
ncbi:hypothetical protein LOD99_9861 [Oopsacas minuta]|uniref:Uncharacterized protein n=1 Tax=Oopsacas minuta TaxID=111878 RepID=A0AAV7KPW7_9METZ|nr:hypothetical protein LOD99_9861 [Oopsacas minuta]